MADTLQIVQWTLEMRCQLRVDEASVKCPEKASISVSSARTYSKALREANDGFGIYGDVLVSSYMYGKRPDGRKSDKNTCYPASGFVISKEFARLGGTDKLFEMCAICPANARRHEIARCVGAVHQRPWSSETEEQLQRIISRLGLASAVATAFPETTPLWYGLWAVSPVPRDSLEVLGILLAEMVDEDRSEMEDKGSINKDHLEAFSALIAAIEVAKSKRLNLHVNLRPLGHTDFGIYTIFPHCPFCKAHANLPRWERRYPIDHCTCKVCGTKFSPSETASSKRMDLKNWSRNELRDELGQKGFEEFAKRYLIANGETSADAIGIVRATEAEILRCEEFNRRKAARHRMRNVYLEQHIYVELDALPSPPSDLDEEDGDSKREFCTGWFAADNFSIVLRRCAEKGIKVTMMQHYSSNPDLDRREIYHLSSPLDILLKWQAEGCNESFHASFSVPDSLLE